ncbi:enoyl-CoA hydratase/isomerase family protein [Pelagibius litoralis]|uniref:Enoyl-CoA hydratase/isomerase family protein n=1 Tax=Pelagibius litoralis TaxID=374515 RepID=A0A967KEN0_9PROT|nr:enoyl-CoA hydratase/isomerase family protein [Pelagibius litoralis]NIA72014.1 enoyl-CoA hydratase/isomerase family protein [Pelagibius litoralis]
MTSPFFVQAIDPRGVARITLTRSEVHNAFNDVLIAELTAVLEGLSRDDRVRLVVLSAQGRSFSAGADLNWMKAMAGFSEAENRDDALRLARLMQCLNELPKPTLALVQGAAYGGGVGLVACCDIVVAAEEAKFCLSEVKLGLTPAVISPYVVAAIGEAAARRYFLTAEAFSAWEAQRLGLVHEVVEGPALEQKGRQIAAALLDGGPKAQTAAKDLIFAVSKTGAQDVLIEETARRIAAVRASDEGREGITAFLEKRRPGWQED